MTVLGEKTFTSSSTFTNSYRLFGNQRQDRQRANPPPDAWDTHGFRKRTLLKIKEENIRC